MEPKGGGVTPLTDDTATVHFNENFLGQGEEISECPVWLSHPTTTGSCRDVIDEVASFQVFNEALTETR